VLCGALCGGIDDFSGDVGVLGGVGDLEGGARDLDDGVVSSSRAGDRVWSECETSVARVTVVDVPI
jgi:hypothetical protein